MSCPREKVSESTYPDSPVSEHSVTCYCDFSLYQLTQRHLLDWHATVDKAELLETFAGYHPGLLAVLK